METFKRACGFIGLYFAPCVPSHNPRALTPAVIIAFVTKPSKNCHTDQPRTSPAINSKKETITKGNNQLIQNFPSDSCCPLNGYVSTNLKDEPSRLKDETA